MTLAISECPFATSTPTPPFARQNLLLIVISYQGSAFDITGLGIANPVATFWTASEMLRWLGQAPAADLLMSAVENVLEAGVKTKDLGGKSTTVEVTTAVCREIENLVGQSLAEKTIAKFRGKFDKEKEGKTLEQLAGEAMVERIMASHAK